MPLLTIALLGPFTAAIDNTPVAFRTDAERALLAYLAAHQGTPQRRDTLATLLSPDRSDSEALTYLRNRLTRLRSAIADETATPSWLIIDRKTIALRAGDDIVIDVTHFEQHLLTVESHAHRQLAGCPTCLARLNAAVALVRGELLAGLNFPSDIWETWLLGQREHMQQRALHAMTLLREVRIEQGDWTAARAVAQRQLTLEPWLEAAHRTVMQAHFQLDDRNAALAQYEECAALLWEELGVEPEEGTQQLRDEIAESVVRPLTGAGCGEGMRTNLPLQSGHFFGRKREQAHLLDRLVDPNYRFITLVGTGGIGKTRLAIEVGRQVQRSFPDGVWFVALDAIKGGPEQIKIAVGEAAGLAQEDKQLTGDQVQAILRDKRMLLLFDNCETVLDELGFIANWLNRAPEVVILATSREPLNFQAESVVLLNGLPIGDIEHGDGEKSAAEPPAAEHMFAERAQLARSDFVLSNDNLPQVRQICALVDGSPLGIALAAAWVRRRSLAQILEAIDKSLDFLSTRLRDVDPRHRSMRAVFETSWQMLDITEQTILAALSVFSTNFSAEAAAQVAGARFFDLDLLCEKSLLQQQIEGERYFMHSLLRHFAADKLAEGRKTDVDRGFVDYFYRFAARNQHNYDLLQPEWHNFSVAIVKAFGQKMWTTVLDFVQTLDEPWFRQARFSDMRAALELALEATKAVRNQPTFARMLLRLGEIELEQNEYEMAETHLAEALDNLIQLKDCLGIADAKFFIGRIKTERAQNDEALALFAESKYLFEEGEDLLGVAKNLNFLAVCHIKIHRDFSAAVAFLEQAVTLQRYLPPTSTYIETLRYLARTKSMLQAYAVGESYLAEAADVSWQLNDVGEYAAVLYEQVLLCKIRSQVDEALTFGYECLDNFKKLGSLRWEALVKTQLGLLHQTKQEYEPALALLTEGLQIFGELADLYEQAYSYYYLHQLYDKMGKDDQSRQAKQSAQRLNRQVNDPQLNKWLN